MNFGKPELVLISRRQKPSVEVMESQIDEWCLLYQDSLSQLWGRRSVFDSLANSKYVHPVRRKITDLAQTGTETWPAIPIPTNRDQHQVYLPNDRVASK